MATARVTATRSGTQDGARTGRRSAWRQIRAARSLLLMFLPGFLLLAIFEYGSMWGLVIAFKDYNIGLGIWDSPWVGLKHFETFFNSPNVLRVLQNTLVISVLKLAWGLPAPIILALLINELKPGFFKRFVQSVSYLPHFISWVILSAMIYSLLSPGSGAINGVLRGLGFEPIAFMTSPEWFRAILIISNVWKEVGWGTIIYLAALAGVSVDLYEAATIDGASRLQRMRHISFPAMMPVVGIVVVLSLGNILNAGFDQVFNLYNPRVLRVGDIIDTYVYRQGLVGLEYSFTAAVGLFKSLVGLILILIANAIARRSSDGQYGLW
jgi:putative aldouronate transport system permease protein